jgi:SAM-dependent methyltransferase
MSGSCNPFPEENLQTSTGTRREPPWGSSRSGGCRRRPARAVAERVGPDGHVLAIDRSAKAIAQLTAMATDLIAAGRLTARVALAEELELEPGEERYDLAFAVRVGAFDGQHPQAGGRALQRLALALVPGGRLLSDGGNPLREIAVPPAT